MSHRSVPAYALFLLAVLGVTNSAQGLTPPALPITKSVTIPFTDVGAISAAPEGIVVGRNVTSDPDGGAAIVDGDAVDGPWTVVPLPMPGSNAAWGHGVARSGDRVAVGAPLYSLAGQAVGLVRIFERVGGVWTLAAELVGDAPNGLFGWSLALDGDLLAIASPGASAGGVASAGMVQLYASTPSGWTIQQALTSDEPRGSDFFGGAVALHGQQLAVGGWGSDRAGPAASGAAWLFEAPPDGAFALAAVILSPSPAFADQLGRTVDVAGDIVVAGAPGADFGGVDRGAVVAATREGNAWNSILLGLPPAVGSHGLGHGVIATPERIVASDGEPSSAVSAVFRREAGIWTWESSSALRGPIARYGPRVAGGLTCCVQPVFGIAPVDLDCMESLESADCNENYIPDACEIAEGLVADLDADGVIDGCPETRVILDMPQGFLGDTHVATAYLASASSNLLTIPMTMTVYGMSTIDGMGYPAFTDLSDSPPQAFGTMVPSWCGWTHASPLAMQPDWFAVGGSESDLAGSVSIFDVATDGSFSLAAEAQGTSGGYFGYSLASTATTLFVGTPGDESPEHPIRRFERDKGGTWTELTPLFLDDPGYATGVALAASGDLLAIADYRDPDSLNAAGAVRIVGLASDGAAELEALLRVPLASLPPAGLFGRQVAIRGDRLFVAGVDLNDIIRGVWVYKRLPDASWVPEADFAFGPSPTKDRLRSLAASPAGFLLSMSGSGVRSYVRRANGAWGEATTVTSLSADWWLGFAVAPFGNDRLATVATKPTFSGYGVPGEVWILNPVTDCNDNAIDDSDEIAAGLPDLNQNGIPDECERPGDMDSDGAVNATDLAIFLGRWGMGPGWGDLDDDGDVDSTDLSILLGDWG